MIHYSQESSLLLGLGFKDIDDKSSLSPFFKVPKVSLNALALTEIYRKKEKRVRRAAEGIGESKMENGEMIQTKRKDK